MAERATTAAGLVREQFTRADGGFRFARWGRDPAPAVFGADAATERLLTGALSAVAGLAGLEVAEEDPEFGKNALTFVATGWDGFADVPGLDRLAPEFERLKPTLMATGANQYRWFHFEPGGAIRTTVAMLVTDAAMTGGDARALALMEAAQTLLLWSETAFLGRRAVAITEGGRAALDPWLADLISAAYDPALPDATGNPALAERLAVGMRALREARG